MVITTSMLKNRYSGYSNPLDKIKRDASNGSLFRLTRGIYETDGNTDPCLLASSILSPSYLSFDWALSYYGLIPEKVFSITSASLNIRKSKTFTNKFGRYEYSDISSNVFSEGLTYLERGDYIVKIATKEKAICDSLSKWRVVNSVKSLKELLFVDKRIDEDEFSNCDFKLMMRLAALYKKTNLDLLIKLIEREYNPTSVRLEPLKQEDEEQFIKDNQYAFKYGAEQYFSPGEMEEQFEEEGEIISRQTILDSIHRDGSITYRIMVEDQPVGGIIVHVDGEKGDLEIFFVHPSCHSKGIGQAAWKEIERIHNNVKVWETVTPCFEKRNIHFYVNKLGFHIVKYYNERCKEEGITEELWEMYRFQKVLP